MNDPAIPLSASVAALLDGIDAALGLPPPRPPGKRCTGPCGQVKPLAAFGRDASKRDGLRPRCRDCRRVPDLARRRPPVPSGFKWCTGPVCGGRVRPQTGFNQNASKADGRDDWCRDCQTAASRAVRAAARAAVFSHYGRACACCGTTGQLTIDHVNGGGGGHRRRLRLHGVWFYRWLIREGFPPGYQTLCRPCNSSKGEGSACRIDHAAARC